MCPSTHLGTRGPGHQGLADLADIEDTGCLDVIPVLPGEGVLGLLLACTHTPAQRTDPVPTAAQPALCTGQEPV